MEEYTPAMTAADSGQLAQPLSISSHASGTAADKSQSGQNAALRLTARGEYPFDVNPNAPSNAVDGAHEVTMEGLNQFVREPMVDDYDASLVSDASPGLPSLVDLETKVKIQDDVLEKAYCLSSSNSIRCVSI
jgi:hypothetical protein